MMILFSFGRHGLCLYSHDVTPFVGTVLMRVCGRGHAAALG